MEDRVKQRLIGVLVIIGALFIILPFLFHNSRPTSGSNLSANIPKPPSTLSVSVTLPPASSTTTVAQQPTTENSSVANSDTAVTNPQTASASTPTTFSTPTAATSSVTDNTNPASTENNTSTVAAKTADNNTVGAAPSNSAPVSATASAPSASTASAAPFTSPSSTGLTTGQTNEGPVQAAAPSIAMKPLSQHAAHTTHHVAAHVVTKGWEIQVGAFSDKANANRLVAKLHERHLEAYVRHITRGHRVISIVFVGPEMNLHKTQMLKNRLKREFHLNGEIKKYEA